MINIASIPGTDQIKLYTLIFVQCLQYLEHEFASELSSLNTVHRCYTVIISQARPRGFMYARHAHLLVYWSVWFQYVHVCPHGWYICFDSVTRRTVWSAAMPHTYNLPYKSKIDDGISDDTAGLRNFQTTLLYATVCVRWEAVNLFRDASANVCLPFQWHNYVCNEMNCGMSHEFHVR